MKLVLLPGLDASGLLYEDFAQALGGEVELVVHAYPGTIPQGYAELENFLIDRLPKDDSYLLLGESFSGPLSISLAARQPPGLRGLVLCCTFAKSPYRLSALLRVLASCLPLKATPRWFRNKVNMGKFATKQLSLLADRAMAGVINATLRKRVKEVLQVNVLAELASVQVPVLYLQANQDRVIGPGAARAIQNALPSTKLVTIEAPHMLLQCAPREAAKAIKSFVTDLSC